ncbi:MAG: hypothetical protein N2578_10340 [Bdellovibrionaceae bacterium]|nr:hypothetical protein [Pseudobdellovibrionaceae bacterium]
MKPPYWKKACRELSANDPILARLIKQYRGETLKSRGRAFETLVRSIVGQQISVKAADSVWRKLLNTVADITPEIILKTPSTDLRAAGLSERKIIYIRDLAEKFLDGHIRPHGWHHCSDEEIILQLTSVRGIGRWTAEMFLIFHLLRPNVFPRDDLGLQKALSILYKKRYPLSERQLDFFAKHFSPWASVATWYLWRSLDPIPVEY